MNDVQLKILKTLKEACSSPVVSQSADERLQAHMADIGTLATYLLVELSEVPQLKMLALSEYAALASAIEKLLSEHQADTGTARKLALLAASGDAAQFDACLGVARDLQVELHHLEFSEAAAWRKKLALVEGTHGKRILEAVAKHTPQNAMPVDDGQTKRFDERKLNEFILRSFPAEKNARSVESKFISGGTSKYTMSIRLTGVDNLPEEIILRGDSALSAGYGGASVVDEYRLLKILCGHGVRVAKPLAAEATGDVFGTPFMLVERRPGVMIGHMYNLPKKPNRTTSRDIAEKLAAIHRVPIDSIGEWMHGAKVSTSILVAAMLDQSYANWQTLQRLSPIYEAAFKWLRNNVAIMDRSRGLVHGDYGLNNLLIENDRVSAILDWEFSHIGNPAYDLGYFYYQAESLASWTAFLDAYRDAGGRVPSDEEIDYSILFAATRLGVMLCQAEAAYCSGAIDNTFMALALGRNCHSVSLSRLSGLLERML